MVPSKQFVSIIVLSQSFFYGITLNNCNRCMCRQDACVRVRASESVFGCMYYVCLGNIWATSYWFLSLRISYSCCVIQYSNCFRIYSSCMIPYLIYNRKFLRSDMRISSQTAWHFYIAYYAMGLWLLTSGIFSSCFWRMSWRLLLFNWERKHGFYVENCGPSHFVGFISVWGCRCLCTKLSWILETDIIVFLLLKKKRRKIWANINILVLRRQAKRNGSSS